MSDTEEANKTMIEELERLRKRVNDLEAEVRDLRQFKAIGKGKDEWFRKLVENMNDGVVVLSKDASITYCNNRLLELLDRRADEVLGRSAYEFIHEEFLNGFGKEFLKRSQGKRGFYEMDLKTSDGGKNPVLCSASPVFDDQGEFQGSLSVLTDRLKKPSKRKGTGSSR
jgi:PAS domain S-box-containing protein